MARVTLDLLRRSTSLATAKIAPAAKPTNGYVLWRGPSKLDGSPIVVIATGIANATKNGKTGAMVQIWILPDASVAPHDATKTGQDAAVCGDCKHRGTVSPIDGTLGYKRACYVKVWQAPREIYEAYLRGIYETLSPAEMAARHPGLKWRLGAYGDPAAVPLWVWVALLVGAKGWTGYSHQWRTCDQLLRQYCMASVDSVDEMEEADAMGWRCFRVRMHDYVEVETGETKIDLLQRHEAPCPASEEMGKVTTCADCMACGGTLAKAKVNIAIFRHPWLRGEHVTRERARQRIAA